MFTSDLCIRIQPGQLLSDHPHGKAILEAVQAFTTANCAWVLVDAEAGSGGYVSG